MIDSGADRHSLDSKVAKRLRLEGQEMSFAVTGSGGIVTSYTNAMNTRVIVKNCEDPTTFWDIQVQCFPSPAGRIIPPNWHALRKDFRHLRDVPVPECRPEPVSLIIGNGNPQLQISLQAWRETRSSPAHGNIAWDGPYSAQPGSNLPETAS